MIKKEYQIGADEYVSDSAVINDVVNQSENVVIVSPPNTGKSSAAIRHLKKTGKHFIFVADSIALAEDLGSSYDLPVYYKDKEEPKKGEPFITIPHHVPKFKDAGCLLVVDEWHTLVTDYGYKREAIDPMVEAFDSFSQIIGLTGTYIPTYLPRFEVIRVEQKRPPMKIDLVSYDALASAIISEIEAHPDKTHFISLFDKSKQAMYIARNLEERGFDGDAISKFNSNTKHEEDIKHFIRTNLMRDGIEVVLATYVQGYSIKGEGYMLHIAPQGKARHSAEDIAQVAQRFRDAKELQINLYYDAPCRTFDVQSPKGYLKDQRREAKRQIGIYKKELGLRGDGQPTDFQQGMIRGREEHRIVNRHLNHDKVNLVRPDLTPNALQIMNNVYRHKTNIIYHSEGLLKKYLRKRGFKAVRKKHINHVVTEEDLKSFPKVEKDEYDTAVKERIKNLRESETHQLPVTDDVSAKISFLQGYFLIEHVEKLLLEYGNSSQARNLLKGRIDVQTSKSPKDKEVREAVYDAFEVGERYSSEAIHSKLNAINKRLPLTETSKMTKRKATRLLKLYFSLSKRKKNTDTGKHEYEILSDYPLKYPMKCPTYTGPKKDSWNLDI